MVVIEALMLSVVGILQGYILSRIDNIEHRMDELRDKLNSQAYDLAYLMEPRRTRKDDLPE